MRVLRYPAPSWLKTFRRGAGKVPRFLRRTVCRRFEASDAECDKGNRQAYSHPSFKVNLLICLVV